jgi:hypothetical protein
MTQGKLRTQYWWRLVRPRERKVIYSEFPSGLSPFPFVEVYRCQVNLDKQDYL